MIVGVPKEVKKNKYRVSMACVAEMPGCVPRTSMLVFINIRFP